jgi:hypothetical protein
MDDNDAMIASRVFFALEADSTAQLSGELSTSTGHTAVSGKYSLFTPPVSVFQKRTSSMGQLLYLMSTSSITPGF